MQLTMKTEVLTPQRDWENPYFHIRLLLASCKRITFTQVGMPPRMSEGYFLVILYWIIFVWLKELGKNGN